MKPFSKKQYKKPPSDIIVGDVFNQNSNWRLIKQNKRNTIAKNIELDVYYKDFSLPKNLSDQIKYVFGFHPAKRSVSGSQLLQRHLLTSPDIIKTGRLGDRNYIIMSDLNGPQLHNTIRSFLTHPTHDRLKWKRKLLFSLGESIGYMHSKGIVHGDLRPNNVILHVDGSLIKIGFIDNERTRKPLTFRFRREQLRNLVQIMMLNSDDVTMTDRMRFFNAYFSIFPHNKKQSRKLLTQVLNGVKERFDRGSSPLGTIIDDQWWDYLSAAKDFFSYTHKKS